jgi:hypothetical protein
MSDEEHVLLVKNADIYTTAHLVGGPQQSGRGAL